MEVQGNLIKLSPEAGRSFSGKDTGDPGKDTGRSREGHQEITGRTPGDTGKDTGDSGKDTGDPGERRVVYAFFFFVPVRERPAPMRQRTAQMMKAALMALRNSAAISGPTREVFPTNQVMQDMAIAIERTMPN